MAYGMPEASNIAMLAWRDSADNKMAGLMHPHAGQHVAIVDPATGACLPAGATDEILVHGWNVLTEPEREHLFMLGLGRPLEVHYISVDGVTPRLQRVLDALDSSAAFIKTAT